MTLKNKKAIICDCDGTICLLNGRDPFDFESAKNDILNEPVANLIRMYKNEGYEIIIVSAREEKFQSLTEVWLNKYSIPYDHIFLRSDNDYRADDIIKREIYEQKIKSNWDIEVVLDDRNRVVKMWREIGLSCLQVNEGNF